MEKLYTSPPSIFLLSISPSFLFLLLPLCQLILLFIFLFLYSLPRRLSFAHPPFFSFFLSLYHYFRLILFCRPHISFCLFSFSLFRSIFHLLQYFHFFRSTCFSPSSVFFSSFSSFYRPLPLSYCSFSFFHTLSSFFLSLFLCFFLSFFFLSFFFRFDFVLSTTYFFLSFFLFSPSLIIHSTILLPQHYFFFLSPFPFSSSSFYLPYRSSFCRLLPLTSSSSFSFFHTLSFTLFFLSFFLSFCSLRFRFVGILFRSRFFYLLPLFP
ncbi:unnamed protein product [Acanthosepion pharaonis]|uniref:Uncharacterized protein n=1 Tax=Acanthosepion pharaonis TaxID=158019 RepID=A0A812BZ09_ACAPH|nr:unnamed protein product [Sepia pharaonis]